MDNVNWPYPADWLGITITAMMTFILICSSVTMVEALGSIQTGRMARYRNFMALTVLGGIVFLGMQAFEWHHLIGERALDQDQPVQRDLLHPDRIPRMPRVRRRGLQQLLLVRAMTGKLTPAKANLVEVAGLYWHFVDLVWILIFTFIYLI